MASSDDTEAMGAFMWAIGRAVSAEARESIATDLEHLADVAEAKGRAPYAERLRFYAASARRGPGQG